VRIGVKPGQWGWSFQELVASWRAAEEAGFDLLSCFDHVSAAPEGRTAWDGLSLLSAMAGHTERIGLGIHVMNACIRHPLLAAGQIAVAQAASANRLEIGIGAGSHYFARYDHLAAGIEFPPFAQRMDRLEACCRCLPPLWRGERVSDETPGLQEASLGPIGIQPPPLLVGGASERALSMAARLADGWHAPEMDDRFAEASARLDAMSDELGRPRIRKSIQLRPSDLAGLRSRMDRLEEAGATTVLYVLDADQRGPDWVRRLADAVL